LFICIVISKGRYRFVPMLIIFFHWAFYSLSKVLEQYSSWYGLKHNNELTRENRWKSYDFYIISFNYLSQMVGDWYPVYKIYSIVPDTKYTVIQSMLCLLFNLSKALPIVHFKLNYDNCYNPMEMNNETKCFETDFWKKWSVLQLIISVVSIVYYFLCWFSINKETFSNYESEGRYFNLIKKFRVYSKYRVRLQSKFAIFAAIMVIPTFLESKGIIHFDLEQIRDLLCRLSYYMIYFDIILLSDFNGETMDQSFYNQSFSISKPMTYDTNSVDTKSLKSLNRVPSVSSHDNSLDSNNPLLKGMAANAISDFTPSSYSDKYLNVGSPDKYMNVGSPNIYSGDEKLSESSKPKILDLKNTYNGFGKSNMNNLNKPYIEYNVNNNKNGLKNPFNDIDDIDDDIDDNHSFNEYDNANIKKNLNNRYNEYDNDRNNNKRNLKNPFDDEYENNNINIYEEYDNENRNMNKPYNEYRYNNKNINKPFNNYRTNENMSLNKPYNEYGNNRKKRENGAMREPYNEYGNNRSRRENGAIREQYNEYNNDRGKKENGVVRGNAKEYPKVQQVATRHIDSLYEQNKVSFIARSTNSNFLMQDRRNNNRPRISNQINYFGRNNKHVSNRTLTDASFITESSITSFINTTFKFS